MKSSWGIALCVVLGMGVRAWGHTMDIIELPNDGGTEGVVDGRLTGEISPLESITLGANLNDGNYTPQVIRVNFYEDAAHTIVSDTLLITVPVQNPPQITLGFSSGGPANGLAALSPEDIGITEQEGVLQTVTTLFNSNGNFTTIRVESMPEAAAVPEVGSLGLVVAGGLGLLVRRRRTVT